MLSNSVTTGPLVLIVGFSPTSQLFWFQQRSICFLKGSSLVRDFFSRFPEPLGCVPWVIRPVLLTKAPWCNFPWTIFPSHHTANSHRVLSFWVTSPFLMPPTLCFMPSLSLVSFSTVSVMHRLIVPRVPLKDICHPHGILGSQLINTVNYIF